MQKPPLAIVTMAYNEQDFLPIWLKHYSRQVGLENCFIIDHGSNDGSTFGLQPASVVHLPRSPLDEATRCYFISQFCNSLLLWYEHVCYVDADEILLADPAKYPDLTTYCRTAVRGVVTSFGLNLLHRLHHEVELLPMGLIGRQRLWAFPSASMCKPSLTSRPIKWAPGFHSADAAVAFDDLFLIHLAYADLEIAKRRQRKRQAQARTSEAENPHHQFDESVVVRWMEGWCAMPTVSDATLDRDCPVRGEFADRIIASQIGRESALYRIDLEIWGDKLWQLPERFGGAF